MLVKAALAERLMLGALAVVAAALIPEGVRVGLWRSGMPGPGLYPSLLLGPIAAICIILFFVSLRRPQPAGDEAETAAPAHDVATVAISLLFVPLLIPWFGYRLVVIAFAFGLMLKLASSRSALATAGYLGLATAVALGTQMLFATGFRVFLPVGKLTGF